MINGAYLPQPYDEILGVVKELQEQDGYTLAKIGHVAVILPAEMKSRLASFMGRRVGILRTETDFRLRVFPDQKLRFEPNGDGHTRTCHNPPMCIKYEL
jgi:hypothetical protein